ncbi:MAG: SpoIID/LytB domain-containing protein [Bacilli bacterium]|nr:SpoIID/LytB domain-containing protein [Bacilli bacterium]
MSSYRANRNENYSSEKDRANKNNAQNVKNAADIAIASKNPYAMAAGKAVKTADKLTGGKSSEALGKGLTKATKKMPAGKAMQDMLNKANESGLGDKLGQTAIASNNDFSTNNQSKANAETNTQKDRLLDEKKSRKEKMDDEEQEREISARGKAIIKKVIILSVPFFLLFFLILFVITLISSSFSGILEDFFNVDSKDAYGSTYNASSEEAQEFYDRINDVKLEMLQEGKSVQETKIVAVYRVINDYDKSVTYDDMSKSKIREIAESMFEENAYNEETFKNNLVNDIFIDYFPEYSEEKRKHMAEEVIAYENAYKELIEPGNNNSSCAAQGTCTYQIKGFNTGSGSISKEIEASNIKVRLMACGDLGRGQPIPGEELVDFEKYITGVVYAETGPGNNPETYKAQAIAARTYSLVRPKSMHEAAGVKLIEENGQTILQIRNCTEDQVYCNPDKGCSTTVPIAEADRKGATIYSGVNTKSYPIKDVLAEDSDLRAAVSSVIGQVLVDANGYLINSGYNAEVQEKWMSQAAAGLDYKQMLMSHYAIANKIAENSCNCSILSSGPYANWKQYEGAWVSVPIGSSGKTIKNLGCLVTSISMLVAKSGQPTTITGDFNPGTFVQALNSNNGFTGSGALIWSTVTKIVPSFKYQGFVSVSGFSKEAKLNKLKELLSNKNNYVVAEVKGDSGEHWVAIDGISDGNIVMMDPGSPSSDLWAEYDWRNTSQFNYYTIG